MFSTSGLWLGQVPLVARPALGKDIFELLLRNAYLQKIDQAEAALAKAEDFMAKHPEIAGNTLWVSYKKFVDLHKKAQDGLPYAEQLKAILPDDWVDLNPTEANILDAWWKDAVDLGNLTGAAAVFYAPPTPSGTTPSPGTSPQLTPTTNIPVEPPKGSTVPLIVGGGIAAAGALALLTLAGARPMTRSPWLGQVPLVQSPWLGEAATPAPGAYHPFPQVPPGFDPATYKAEKPSSSTPPGPDCVFVGHSAIEILGSPAEDAAEGFRRAGWTVKYIYFPPLNAEYEIWACPPKTVPRTSPPSVTPRVPAAASTTPLIVGGGIAAAGAIALLTLSGAQPMTRSPWLGQVRLAR